MKRCNFGLLLPLMLMAAQPSRAQNGVTFLDDEAEAGGYDVTATLTGLPCDLWLAQQANGDAYRVSLTASGLQLGKQHGAKVEPIGAANLPIRAGQALVAQRRGPSLNFIVGGRVVLQAEDDAYVSGKIGYRGGVTDCRVQPVEPINFTDDFMRVAADVAMKEARLNPRSGVKIKDAQFTEDIWNSVRGKWQTTGLTENSEAQVAQSANPFAFKSAGAGQSIALTGRPFWDDYTASLSVQAQGANAMGVLIYAQDENNYLGMIWPADSGPQLRSVVGGKVTVLDNAASFGGFDQKQWYRLRVSVSGGTVRGFVDDEEAVRARTNLFGRGRVGVFAQSADDAGAAIFDDAKVLTLEDFGDDFSQVVPGRWKSVVGSWTWKDAARPVGRTGAYAVMGEPDWSDYTTSGTLFVPSTGTAGLLLHHIPGKGAYVMRVSGSESGLPYAGQVQLVKIAGGKTQVLAQTSVGGKYNGTNLVWSVSDEHGYLCAQVDGSRIIDAYDDSLPVGRAGVYGQGGVGGVVKPFGDKSQRAKQDADAAAAALPRITDFAVTFPKEHKTWAVVPDMYELEQQAQTMGGWSTPEGLWTTAPPTGEPATAAAGAVPAGFAATTAPSPGGATAPASGGVERTVWHKGAFWGDDTLRFALPDLPAGKSLKLIFNTKDKRQLTLTFTVADGLKADLTDSKATWSGSYKSTVPLADQAIEVARRGSYVIVKVGKEGAQKLVLAASVG